MLNLSVKWRGFTDKLSILYSLSMRKRFNPDKLCLLIHLSGKTYLFPDKIYLDIYSGACPEDKPVKAVRKPIQKISL